MNKTSPQIKITDAEWDVLNEVWQQNPIAATDVTRALKSERNWSLGTVRTLLTRLVDKGALEAKKVGRRFLYSPLVSMEACLRQKSQSFIDRVFGGAPSSVILNLVRDTELSQEDIKELRRILRDKEQK